MRTIFRTDDLLIKFDRVTRAIEVWTWERFDWGYRWELLSEEIVTACKVLKERKEFA